MGRRPPARSPRPAAARRPVTIAPRLACRGRPTAFFAAPENAGGRVAPAGGEGRGGKVSRGASRRSVLDPRGLRLRGGPVTTFAGLKNAGRRVALAGTTSYGYDDGARRFVQRGSQARENAGGRVAVAGGECRGGKAARARGSPSRA